MAADRTYERCIVPLGGGGFSSPDSRIDDYLLSLTGVERPRVCFVPTASGDADSYIVRFYTAMARRSCVPSHLALTKRTVVNLAQFLLSQDVIYVGGGNTANMLAIWRVHGVETILRDAWERGIILCGPSAGGLCWFECGVTDSFGPLAPLHDGMKLLPGSFCPHYDGEVLRRPTYQRLIAEQALPAGIAADDDVGLVYEGTRFVEAVSTREGARAFRLERRGEQAVEEPIVPRLL